MDHAEMAFCCAVEPDDVRVPEPLQEMPFALVVPLLELGADEEPVDEVEVLELLDPHAATASRVLAANATDPYWLHRRVERTWDT